VCTIAWPASGNQPVGTNFAAILVCRKVTSTTMVIASSET